MGRFECCPMFLILCDMLDGWKVVRPLLGAWSLFSVGLWLPMSDLGSFLCFGMYVCSGLPRNLSKLFCLRHL